MDFAALDGCFSASQKSPYSLPHFDTITFSKRLIACKAQMLWFRISSVRKGYMATAKSCLKSAVLSLKKNEINETIQHRGNLVLWDSQLHAPLYSEVRTSFLHWYTQPSKYFMWILLLL